MRWKCITHTQHTDTHIRRKVAAKLNWTPSRKHKLTKTKKIFCRWSIGVGGYVCVLNCKWYGTNRYNEK